MHRTRDDKVRLIAGLAPREELLAGVQLDRLSKRLEPIHPKIALDCFEDRVLRSVDLPEPPYVQWKQKCVQHEHRHDMAERAVGYERDVACDTKLTQPRTRAHKKRGEDERQRDVTQE